MNVTHNTPFGYVPGVYGVATTLVITGGPSSGSINHYAPFEFVYTPNNGFSGTDYVSYRVDGPGGSSPTYTGTFNVAAAPLPAAPTVGNVTTSTAYQTAVTFAPNLGGGPADRLDVGGTASGTPSVSGMNLSFSPNPGFSGAATFAYSATGPGGRSPDATVTVNVAAAPLPPAPGAGNVSAATAYQTSVGFTFAPSGDYWAIQGVSNPSNGSVTWPGGSGTNGTYHPNAGFYGTDSFAYRVTGPGGTSGNATVSVSVGAPPAPSASGTSVNVPFNTKTDFGVSLGGVWSHMEVMSWPGAGSVVHSGSTFGYTPSSGYYGSDSFTFRAVGPGGNSATATVTLNVATPSAPGAGNVSASTAYETATAIGLTPSGEYSSVQIVSQPSSGSASISGTTATYSPYGGFIGTDSFTYLAVGPGGNSPTRTVTVTVNAPPAPVARNVSVTTAYGQAVTFAVDVSGAANSINLMGAGSETTGSGLYLTFTPSGGFHGTRSFSYAVSGPGGSSNWATVTVTVLPPPPLAGAVSANVPFETKTTVPHAATGDFTQVMVVSQPAYGAASIVGGELTYAPNTGYYGADSFTYRARGAGGDSAPATVSITVGLPPAPTAADTSLTTIFEQSKAVILPVAGILTEINVIAAPGHGTASVTGTTLTYTPAADYLGADTLSYNATGPGGASNTHVVNITVTPPALPTVSNAALSAAFETAGSVNLAMTGYKAVVKIETDPAHGSASVIGATVSYVPEAGYYGPDAFTVSASNVAGVSAPATVSVTVGLPPAPTVSAASLTTGYEESGAADLAASGVFTVFEIVTGPTHGTASLAGNRVTYTPTALHYGADSLTYRAIGPGGASAPATVAITVGFPGAPSISAATLTTPYQTAGSVDLSASGVYLSVEVVDAPEHGTATISGERLTYTPDALHYGADSLTVRAVGPGANSAPATVAITVGNPPAPTISGTTITTAYETAGVATLAVSGIATSLEVVTSPANGTVSISGLTLTYTPDALHYGIDSLTVRAVGPGGASAPATVSVTIGLPPAPVATALPLTTPFETPGTVTLAATGRASSFALADLPAHGTVTLAGAVARYTPNAGYYGADSFTFTATGPGGTSSPATVTVGVGLPGRPVASPDSIATAYETAGSVTLRATGTFDDFQIVTAPSHGTLSVSGAVVTFTPDAGYYGADSFTFTASGPGGVSNPATVAVTVGNPPAPTISAATITTAYETASGTDLVGSGVFTRLEVESQPANGSASIAGDRLTYTPNARHYGADSLTVRAVGPGGNSAPAAVTVTVGLPGAPSVASASLATTYETAGSVDLAASGFYTTLEIVSAPAHGTATISGETLNYTPGAGYSGGDTLTVRAVGPGGNSAPATVTVTVSLPGAPSLSNATINTAYETVGTTTLTPSGVYSSLEIVTQGDHGAASISGTTLTYTPDALHYGADTLTVRAVGPGGASAPATVAVTVGLPGAPVVQNATITTAYETAGSVDLDASGVYSTLEVVTGPTNGTATITGDQLTYTPASAYFGADVVTVRAVGPGGASAPATVAVTVGLPGLPTVEDVAASTPMDVAVEIELTAVGVFSGLEITSAPANGSAVLEGQTVTYAPSPDFFGTDSFTYLAIGPAGNSAPATVTITVEGGPPPDADNMEKTGLSGEPIVFDVTAGLDGGPFQAVRLEALADTGLANHHGGTVRVEGLRIVFTPAVDWNGRTSFRFAVENRFGWSVPAVATAIVNPRPTTGAVIEAETWAGRPVDVSLTADANGGPFLAADIVSATPADALDLAVRKVGDGYVLTATPRGQFFGLVEIRYTLRNAYAVSEPGLLRLTVKERPDPSRDPEVTGLVNAQTQAAYRFSSAQMTNVLRRLEQLHGEGPRRNHVGLSLVSMDDLSAIPGDNDAMRALREYMEKAGMIEHGPAAPSAAPRSASGGTATGRFAWWMEGAVDLGFKRRDEVREGFKFTTDGLTAGADAEVSDTLTVGVGAGFGRDRSDVGSKGTETSADAYSGFAYASWQPREKLFVDGVLGYTSMAYDAARYVTETGGLLESQRNGRQFFGAVSAGYEHRGRRLHWSPYGRVEFAAVRLGGFRETGDDLWSLEFAGQRSSQVRAALGVHGDYLFSYRTGDLKPTFRVEYQHDLKNGGQAGVRYADWMNSPDYQVELTPYDARNLRLGFGIQWQSTEGQIIGVEYESTVANSAGQEGRVSANFSTKF